MLVNNHKQTFGENMVKKLIPIFAICFLLFVPAAHAKKITVYIDLEETTEQELLLALGKPSEIRSGQFTLLYIWRKNTIQVMAVKRSEIPSRLRYDPKIPTPEPIRNILFVQIYNGRVIDYY
jgi:hypothetical protein